MREVINIYKKHKVNVDNFIGIVIKSLPEDYIKKSKYILDKNRYIQLMYSVDENYKQSSPVIFRKDNDDMNLNSDKSHYFMKLNLDEDGIYISNPYIHYKTGKASLSVVKKKGDHYFIFDFDLIFLLEELRLIDYNTTYDRLKRAVYVIGSVILGIIAIVLIGYGGYSFLTMAIGPNEFDFFESTFKAIISVTLGIAIFDLAKQIFEHEVIFHSFSHANDRQYKVLGKFLISIIIALSIETLMVVFKITLDDYTHMDSAFYLLIGTTLMFMGLAYFYKSITQSAILEEKQSHKS
jgi:hypothetical protein